jgi:hypothetical protein
MTGNWTYDAVTNKLTGVGGTSSTPCSLIDMWNADKAGTYTIVASRNILGIDASPVAVTAALRPSDYNVLGGADLYLTITGFTAAATIRITGRDALGITQSEDITITANGVYPTANFYRTVTSTQVVTYNDIFTYQMDQGQWGVVWKNQTNRQYRFDCAIQIGDGTTITYWADAGKSIMWSNFMAWGATIFTVMANTYFTSGTLLNEANKTTCNGLHYFVDNLSGQRIWFVFNNNSQAVFYSSVFGAASSGDFYLSSCPKRFWNCILNMAVFRYLSGCDLFNVQFWQTGNNGVFQNSYTGNTMDRIWAYSCSAVIKTDGTGPPVIKNLYARNCSTILLWNNNGVGAVAYLINPDVDVFIFSWSGNASTVYIQYELDLTIRDDSGVAISDASVKILNRNNDIVVDTTTDASGKIATHLITQGYFNTANGNTLQTNGPFTLKVYKQGTRTYYDAALALDKKTVLELTTPKRPW